MRQGKIKFSMRLSNIKIKNKLILSFVLVVFIPVLFVGVFLTDNMKKNAMEQSVREAKGDVDRIESELLEILELSELIENKIIADLKVYEIISREYCDALEIFRNYSSYTTLSDYEITYRDIEDIRIYVENSTLLDNLDFMQATDEIKNKKWYQKAVEANGKITCEYYYDKIKNKNFLAINRYYRNTKNKAVIMILVDIDYLVSLIEDETFETMIIDNNGNIIVSKIPDEIGTNINDLEEVDFNNEQGLWVTNYRGKRSQMIVHTVTNNKVNEQMQIVAAFPIEKILKSANQASMLGLSVILISLTTATILIIIFSNGFAKRIKQIRNDMNRVSQGDFGNVSVINGDDEIGQLSRNLNTMVKSIKDLMAEITDMHEKEQEFLINQEKIRFEMLANQINPHFLFNVLESIRMKAHLQGEKEISNIVKLLGQLIRRNLELTNDIVSIEEELKFVESYFTIQKFRFGESISYDIKVEESLEKYCILPLIIQPIVENSIIHGIGVKGGNGHVLIDIRRINDYLSIVIEDNGIGMEKEKLKELKESLMGKDSTNNRIGLKNIEERIHFYYGSSYGLEIDSDIDIGTKVTILLPDERVDTIESIDNR
ncbi:hypothetical protein SH1V18_42720 [Vallitalea longa]|uniref:HAMP domain-containing protein n=1 Tax=Vallitalea longa TaxID=2936439 RepID=A0A9W5YD62_9FIRM|nr:sensor histidine kinase [Vallitalea longa]GKX31792.1 hypothetical protein SH1V18_42720 [Vallitalea longa]